MISKTALKRANLFNIFSFGSGAKGTLKSEGKEKMRDSDIGCLVLLGIIAVLAVVTTGLAALGHLIYYIFIIVGLVTLVAGIGGYISKSKRYKFLPIRIGFVTACTLGILVFGIWKYNTEIHAMGSGDFFAAVDKFFKMAPYLYALGIPWLILATDGVLKD